MESQFEKQLGKPFFSKLLSHKIVIRYEGEIYIEEEIKVFLLCSHKWENWLTVISLLVVEGSAKPNPRQVIFSFQSHLSCLCLLTQWIKIVFHRRDIFTMEEIQPSSKRPIQIQSLSLWHIWHHRTVREGYFSPVKFPCQIHIQRTKNKKLRKKLLYKETYL